MIECLPKQVPNKIVNCLKEDLKPYLLHMGGFVFPIFFIVKKKSFIPALCVKHWTTIR